MEQNSELVLCRGESGGNLKNLEVRVKKLSGGHRSWTLEGGGASCGNPGSSVLDQCKFIQGFVRLDELAVAAGRSRCTVRCEAGKCAGCGMEMMFERSD